MDFVGVTFNLVTGMLRFSDSVKQTTLLTWNPTIQKFHYHKRYLWYHKQKVVRFIL